jgi:hypothetical protein
MNAEESGETTTVRVVLSGGVGNHVVNALVPGQGRGASAAVLGALC